MPCAAMIVESRPIPALLISRLYATVRARRIDAGVVNGKGRYRHLKAVLAQIPGLGEITSGSGFVTLAESSDGVHEVGKDGVVAIVATGATRRLSSSLMRIMLWPM